MGVIPTPGVAYITKKMNADASVVISASHNTFEFNGIKYFCAEGTKIPDEIEEEIEEVMDSGKIYELSAINEKIGVSEIKTEYIDDYLKFFKDNFAKDIAKYNRDDFVVGIDTANGATYEIAKRVFSELGIKYKIINDKPNGININHNCGSTHLEEIKKKVVDEGLSLGIAYDGDGDRCLAVDENGNTIDGDVILAITSQYMKEKGSLKKDTVVATVMSNLGLNKYAQNSNLELKQTKVGDRYVLEEMKKNGYNLGGEQSGHVIFLDYNPTGDGILTSLMLIKILLEKNVSASEMAKVVSIYPQVLINAKVSSDKKYDFDKDEIIKQEIEKVQKEFAGNGRVLIRASGTEPLVRVMIEGENKEYITEKAKAIADLIENRLS